MDEQNLIDAALDVRRRAYCRYSNYSVGSALLDDKGAMHVGCNVENAAYPEGTCAEANAIEDCTPCGGCRQKIAEFAEDDTRIILLRPGGHTREFHVDDLLPRSFHL